MHVRAPSPLPPSASRGPRLVHGARKPPGVQCWCRGRLLLPQALHGVGDPVPGLWGRGGCGGVGPPAPTHPCWLDHGLPHTQAGAGPENAAGLGRVPACSAPCGCVTRDSVLGSGCALLGNVRPPVNLCVCLFAVRMLSSHVHLNPTLSLGTATQCVCALVGCPTGACMAVRVVPAWLSEWCLRGCLSDSTHDCLRGCLRGVLRGYRRVWPGAVEALPGGRALYPRVPRARRQPLP
jgi:hypothetical protein